MPLIQRVQDILLKPKATWPVIDGEGGDVASIYRNYLVYLAAIPAVAAFIGLSLIGVGAFGYSMRVPVLGGLAHMVVRFVLSLVMVFVLGLIVDALAPTFGGTKNSLNAFKLVAYGSTAGFVGGIFGLIPALGILGLVAGLYSIYLIYTGVPVMMKCPPGKAGAYTTVVIVCAVIAAVVLGTVLSMFGLSGAGRLGAFGSRDSGSDVTISTPRGDVKIDTAKIEAMSKKLEEASKSGDPAAAGKAAGAMLGAVTGTNAAPIPAADLKALLPEAIGELKRETLESSGGEAAGIGGSSAKASFANGERRVRLSVTDLGGLGGVAALAGWANVTADRETGTEVEKTYKAGSATVHEKQRKDGSSAEYTVLLPNGVVVEAQGDQIDVATLKGAVEGLDLGRIEAMKRAAK